MSNTLTLVGDNIENPLNAATMIHAAGMFGCECWFRDGGVLAQNQAASPGAGGDLTLVSLDQVKERCPLIVAFDNAAGAADVYGFRLPQTPSAALVVGNERRGIAADFGKAARYALQIPMVSRQINCLNVAAASAVGLYYLARGGGQKMRTANHPEKSRPDLLLVGGTDHVELGSAIRSACAFGWERALVEDRFGVWFGCDRVTRSEGRAAARRGRNPIRLHPATPSTPGAYASVAIITTRQPGAALPQAKLAEGPRQLLVIPDESNIDAGAEDWKRLGGDVQFINPGLPIANFVYHYRLIASIALAEAARQVGRKPAGIMRERPPARFAYDKALRAVLSAKGELVFLEELDGY